MYTSSPSIAQWETGGGFGGHGMWANSGQAGGGMGDALPEILQMQCIHGNVKNYPTLLVRLQLVGRSFCCLVGVVPHWDSPALVGLNGPIDSASLLAYCSGASHLLGRGPPTAARNYMQTAASGTEGKSIAATCMGMRTRSSRSTQHLPRGLLCTKGWDF